MTVYCLFFSHEMDGDTLVGIYGSEILAKTKAVEHYQKIIGNHGRVTNPSDIEGSFNELSGDGHYEGYIIEQRRLNDQ